MPGTNSRFDYRSLLLSLAILAAATAAGFAIGLWIGS
jgi:hypothetical protein